MVKEIDSKALAERAPSLTCTTTLILASNGLILSITCIGYMFTTTVHIRPDEPYQVNYHSRNTMSNYVCSLSFPEWSSYITELGGNW